MKTTPKNEDRACTCLNCGLSHVSKCVRTYCKVHTDYLSSALQSMFRYVPVKSFERETCSYPIANIFDINVNTYGITAEVSLAPADESECITVIFLGTNQTTYMVCTHWTWSLEIIRLLSKVAMKN